MVAQLSTPNSTILVGVKDNKQLIWAVNVFYLAYPVFTFSPTILSLNFFIVKSHFHCSQKKMMSVMDLLVVT